MKCTTRRDENVIREKEFEDTLRKLDGEDIIKGTYETTVHGKSVVQKFNIYCKRTQCLLCILWMFGKRISEVLLLRKRDMWIEDGYLYVRFIVRKKRERRSVPSRFVKKITLEHPYIKYVVGYVESLSDPESYLFPGRSKPRTYKTKVDGKVYTYERTESGYMSANLAWKIIKFLNPKLYPHLFRDSLATLMAEHEFTEDLLMSWFDWDSSKVAHEYVKHGPKLSEKASDRTW